MCSNPGQLLSHCTRPTISTNRCDKKAFSNKLVVEGEWKRQFDSPFFADAKRKDWWWWGVGVRKCHCAEKEMASTGLDRRKLRNGADAIEKKSPMTGKGPRLPSTPPFKMPATYWNYHIGKSIGLSHFPSFSPVIFDETFFTPKPQSHLL